jgi:hypothetical protein
MPLTSPPDRAGSLSALPRQKLSGRCLYRVWRTELPDGGRREDPWWFASADTEAGLGGRFDLPEPMGTCYLATRPEAALLEALQMRLTHLPASELRVRRVAVCMAPDDAPDAAMLTARRTAGEWGITAELWAGRDRSLTRRWAQAIRRDGWWAVYSGVSHDPSGRLRSVALFDQQGAHPPTHGDEWRWRAERLAGNQDLMGALKRFGVRVREPGQLPWAKQS